MCWRMWETVGYSVMNAITFISAPQKEHNKGLISYTLLMSAAQLSRARLRKGSSSATGKVVGMPAVEPTPVVSSAATGRCAASRRRLPRQTLE